MRIKILSVQIPMFWETIKFVVKTVDNVKEKELPEYLNDMLQALLNDKAQCFIEMDDNTRELHAMCITRLLYDKVIMKNYLFIQCLYSFKPLDDSVWRKGLDLIHQFAKAQSCAYISCSSKNQRIWDIVTGYGYDEVERVFKFNIGG